MKWFKPRGYRSGNERAALPRVPGGPAMGVQVTLTLPVTPPDQRDAAARAIVDAILRYEQIGRRY